MIVDAQSTQPTASFAFRTRLLLYVVLVAVLDAHAIAGIVNVLEAIGADGGLREESSVSFFPPRGGAARTRIILPVVAHPGSQRNTIAKENNPVIT
jgi:hypothetical protein